MELLEYQAKQLFKEVGIPTLPSQTVADSRELKDLQIAYPVVLKSQVRSGGRGIAGGIRFVENTIDAIAAARAIFNLPISGEYPQVLLAEARYNTEQEVFLAVVLDYQLQQPVLIGSANGGMNADALLDHLHKVTIAGEFSPFYARRLAIAMGLEGRLIETTSTIIEKMYRLFIEKDLDAIEINPLGVEANGEVMALDGKISANDNAIDRHVDLLALAAFQNSAMSLENSFSLPVCRLPGLHWLADLDQPGELGLICNSELLAHATWDLVAGEKGQLSSCLIVEDRSQGTLLPPSALAQQMAKALTMALAVESKILLINIVGNEELAQATVQAILEYWQPHLKQQAQKAGQDRENRAVGAPSRRRQRPQEPAQHPERWVVRLTNEFNDVKEQLAEMPIDWVDSLEAAVKAVSSKSK
ncbi:MAG: ATP-grasp domain-containing protein [Cyanophyceae cyanobacterium]